MGGFALDIEPKIRLRPCSSFVYLAYSLHYAIGSLGLDLECGGGGMVEVLVKELLAISRGNSRSWRKVILHRSPAS